MGSLRFSANAEIFTKRFNFSCDSDHYEANWNISCSWVSHVGIRFKADRKKTVSGEFVRCCGFNVTLIDDNPFKTPGIRSSAAGLIWWNPDPKCRIKYTRAHGLKGIEEIQSGRVDNVASIGVSVAQNHPVSRSIDCNQEAHVDCVRKKSERKIWNRVANSTKAARRKVQKPVSTPKGQVLEYISNGSEVESTLSNIMPESSIKYCNSVLKSLEKSNDEKALSFFEWMKENGKLERNTSAYNFALRVLARREDWNRARMLLKKMASDSNCELSPQVFNSLIYVCAKRSLASWGTKWFRLMLEKGVQPDIATIGMLMGLYQKSRNLSQAEFVFEHMRSSRIRCVKAYSAMITIYTRSGMYGKSEEIFGLMEQDKVLPDLENWLVRLNTFSQQGKLREAESVLKTMQDMGIPPNIVAYNMLIKGYGKVSDTKSAKLLFQGLQSAGLKPDETTYRSMVEGFGRADDYKEALRYYIELKHLGFQPSSSNFYTMINLQCRHDDKIGAIQTLKDMKATGCQCSSIVSILLQAFEKVGMIEDVPLILKDSLYESILLDPTSCSILVMSYVKNSLLDDALRVLEDKKWKDLGFEDNLYHLLICSCKEASHYESAVKIYTRMQKPEMNPNLHIACSMIDIYTILDRFDDAENLYLKLKASGVIFDIVAYTIVVRMYMKSGSLRGACSVLDTMEQQKDIVPDKFLFIDMLRIYQQCGMLEKLTNVYYWISRTGITWDEAMYSFVINCCGRALPVDEISRLFDNMIRCGYTANTVTLNIMLDVYGKAGLLKKARKVFWMARRQGAVDVISYNTIIAAYGQIKDFKSMRYFVRRMKAAGFAVSLEAYNCMLDVYGKEGLLEEFDDVLKEMRKSSCVSDHYTYNIMINIYGMKGWIEEVSRVLGELKEHGLEPDLYSYNTLIKAYGIAGMVEDAVNVVQKMRAEGIEPDRVTFVNLVAALQRNENFLEAVKWSLWMKQTGVSS